MNNKVLIILIILLLLYFVSRAKTIEVKPVETPVVPNKPDTGEYKGTYSWKYYKVKSGDTFYKIAKENIPLERAKEVYKGFNDGQGNPQDTEMALILRYAQQLATANGFDWALFDSKPTSELRDPDTLKVGQKIVLWSWNSFRENENENGFLLPFVQYNKFRDWNVVDDAQLHMKDAFINNPPKSL